MPNVPHFFAVRYASSASTSTQLATAAIIIHKSLMFCWFFFLFHSSNRAHLTISCLLGKNSYANVKRFTQLSIVNQRILQMIFASSYIFFIDSISQMIYFWDWRNLRVVFLLRIFSIFYFSQGVLRFPLVFDKGHFNWFSHLGYVFSLYLESIRDELRNGENRSINMNISNNYKGCRA